MSAKRPDRFCIRPGSLLAVLKEAFGNCGFVACLALLLIFAIGLEVLAVRKDIQFRKEALPLKNPLQDLDQTKLAPYKLVFPHTLEPDQVDQLGTDQYVQWELRDTSEDGPAGRNPPVYLFVTYYTGKPDQVPHVPEVCYQASGHRLVRQSLAEIEIPALGEGQIIPVQVLEFQREGLLGRSERLVMYTIHANGQFCRSRRHAQLVIANPRSRYAYFSKLEITLSMGKTVSSKEDAINAGARFLNVVVPVLLEDHWPDWEGTVGGSASQAHTGGTTGTAAGPDRAH